MSEYDVMDHEPERDSARREKTALPKSVRWIIVVLAALCVVSCTACVALLVQRSRERSEEARLREVIEAKVLELQAAAEPEPVPEPEPEPEPEVSSEERLANAAASVIYLETYDENGECIASASGFLTGIRTLVTNYHVVQDAYEVYGWTTDDKSVMISNLLAYDEVADLAVLQCDWPPSACVLCLADSDEVRQGLNVYAVGYPLGLANTMSNGIVSARYVDEYGVDTIQHTAAISYGSSGGPLLNGDGEVIGVVCAYYEDGQNLNLAVSSNTLKELLEETGEPLPLTEWTDRPLMPDQELWDEAEEAPAPEPKLQPEPEPEPEPPAEQQISAAISPQAWSGKWTFADYSAAQAENNWFQFDFDRCVVIWSYEFNGDCELYEYPFRIVDGNTIEMSQDRDLNSITDRFQLNQDGTILRTWNGAKTWILVPVELP